jgi:chromosome segregation ATPase
MTSTLENVDGRLRDLEEEMTELREFQEKERERKALEYAMYEGELEEITGTLGDVRSPASAAVSADACRAAADTPSRAPCRWRPSATRR